MATPEPYPYRKLNYPINNLEQNFTQEQKLQTRSNIGIPSSVDEEGKVLMVDNAAGELVWAEAPNGLPDIASGDEGKFLSVENGEPAWTDVDIPEQVNADWDATSGVQEILNKPNLATVATTGQYADLLGKPDIPASTSELVNDSGFITLADVPTPPAQLNADWDATSGVQEILNKPASKRVYAGNNITITEDADGFTISSQSESQVNADWDATSGVQEILNKPNLSTVAITGQYADLLGKPDIPASTSELVNDSDFITLSDIPAQVNADWNSDSGVSEILNKPDLSIYAESSDLATVATSGSYNDLLDKPSIPSAQVNADWDATSGVSEILNKPNLATVATTGDYSDLQNLPSIPAAQINSDWSATSGVQEILNKPNLSTVALTGQYADIIGKPDIPASTSELVNDSGFITLSDLPPEEVEVLTYGTSTLADYLAALQSGKKIIVCRISDPDSGWRYVMQSQSSPFPQWSYDIGVVHYQLRLNYNGNPGWTTLTTNSTTSADAGKVFTVDQYGRQVWATGGGGGGSQVNADWDATSGVAEILNKPTPKTLTAGANISISEGVDTLTISSAAGLPASTSADEGKCLVVDSNGDPEWGTGGKTYTGVDGVTVDNVNDTVGLEAPVDIVAGPGIAIDNPDGNTVRISVNQPARETVLYYSDAGAPGDTQRTYALSETPMNFERIGIFMFRPVSGNWMGYTEFDTAYMQAVNKTSLTVPIAFINNTDHFLGVYGVSGILTSSWADVQGGQMVIGSSYSKGYFAHIYKIIGINRIAGGN